MASPERPLPPALRSFLQLRPAAATSKETTVPITQGGSTFTMAQEAAWLDEDHFAVGRWDGSLEIYQYSTLPSIGPLISHAVSGPAGEGLQMVLPIDERQFLTSNNEASLALWLSPSPNAWAHVTCAHTLRYSAALGAANSATLLKPRTADPHIVVGHANGFLSFWRPDRFRWELTASLDIRGNQPVNPWGLHNIRGLAIIDLKLGLIVAGSEDGDLTIVDVDQSRIVSKSLYNPAAKRGINALAFSGAYLLVANCAVGAADRNLWAYHISLPAGTITQTDASNLAIDATAPQVFNFDVTWGDSYRGVPAFFASTEEGVVWMGTCDESGHVSILGNAPVSRKVGADQLLHLGSGICYSRSRLAVANYDVTQFRIG